MAMAADANAAMKRMSTPAATWPSFAAMLVR